MTRRKVAKVLPIPGRHGDVSYRVEWWFAGTRRRSPNYNDRDGGEARAHAVARVVNAADGDITRDEADAATRPPVGGDAPEDHLPTSLGFWLDEWVRVNRAPEASSGKNYANQLKRLVPFRDLDVVTWDAEVSADVLDDLKTRFADSTSVITFDRISGALALAYARRVRPVPAPKAPMAVTDLESPGVALEDDELAAVRRAVAVDGELSDAVALMIQTGMRIGEVCALQGGDLDLRRGALTVRRTVKADQRSTGKPKNGKRGVRLIVIDPARESALWRMLIARREVAGRSGYLFHRSVTTNSLRKDPALYALPSRMRERWERLVRGALGSEVPDGVRLHDLRHTNGSVLLASGRWDPIAVARRLGMSLVMLERIYGHDLATTQDAMGAFAAEWGAEGEAATRRAAIHAV